MTHADKVRARKLAWGIFKWVVLAPSLLVIAVILLFLGLLWHAGNIRAQESPQLVIVCQLTKDASGGSRTALYIARSHAHCYKAASTGPNAGAYAFPSTYSLPDGRGRLLALCGKDFADCPELP